MNWYNPSGGHVPFNPAVPFLKKLCDRTSSTWAHDCMCKTTSVGKDVEELESLCMAGGRVKWYSCCGKQYGGSSHN